MGEEQGNLEGNVAGPETASAAAAVPSTDASGSEPVTAPASGKPAAANPAPSGGGGKKILVVEDERALSTALKLKLQKSGFEPTVASDGVEAIETFSNGTFDVVLLDLIIPKKDGFQVLTEIKAKNKDIKVIVISNLGQEEDMKRATELGASGFLIKSNTPLSAIVKYLQENT